MKKVGLFIAFILIACTLLSQAPMKVACVGNSVTYGAGLTDRETTAYPAQLQMLLGDAYEVKNFGKSGATLLTKGHRPYIKEKEYKEALDFAADKVIIHLGLNDTDPRNWPNYKDEFVADYLELIRSFREVNPSCELWICRLTPITPKHTRFLSGTRDWHEEIQQKIEQIAAYADVHLIDLQETLYHRPDLLPDALHPNEEGASLLAKTVYSALTGDFGGLQMPIIYTDSMVLQRDRYLKIRGIANSQDLVTVSIGSQVKQTTTGMDGKWEIIIDPLTVGDPLTLQVSTADKRLTFKDVLVGEVWLCSGQSNMAFQLKAEANYDKVDVSTCAYPIRFFDMKPQWETHAVKWDSTALRSLNQLQYFSETVWTTCDDESAASFSAVAYYFGRMLADSLQVPIGLIHNAVGGATLESWIDRETLEHSFPEILNDWTQNDFIQGWARERALLNISHAQTKNQRHPYEPCYLYESAILPLNAFPIQGVIWYQGESNAHNIEAFERLFPLFVSSWRNHWGMDKLPFYYVQLSSLNRPSWTWFRDSQRKMMDKIPHIYMAVSSDRGDSLDVHPRDKKDVAERLARWALHNGYDQSLLTPSGPLVRSVEFEEPSVYVSFEYGQGMCAADKGRIIGFEVAEVDGLYHPAEAVVEEGRIKVFSSEVSRPMHVRYGWQPFTRANLVNDANLPASTFHVSKQTLQNMTDIIQCEPLPDYPIEGGVSGVFAGVHQDKLIVAGGCNFPHAPAAAGGEKVFYKEAYWMDISDNAPDRRWTKATAFPYPVAYGSAVTTEAGVVCIGGQNKEQALADVWLIQFDDKQNDWVYSRLPSLPVSHLNGSASVYNEVIYVAGGSFGDQANGRVYSLDLNNSQDGWKRMDGQLAFDRQQPVVIAQESSLLLAGGYDEQAAKVHTDVIQYDFSTGQWEEYVPIKPEEQELKTFVGAGGVTYSADEILFVGGVNYQRFDAALQRIKKTAIAAQENDEALFQQLKEKGREYMSQEPEWYKFNQTLTLFNLSQQRWYSLGDYDEIARAGAGIVCWNGYLYVICGELKPGVRTRTTNRLTLR